MQVEVTDVQRERYKHHAGGVYVRLSRSPGECKPDLKEGYQPVFGVYLLVAWGYRCYLTSRNGEQDQADTPTHTNHRGADTSSPYILLFRQCVCEV